MTSISALTQQLLLELKIDFSPYLGTDCTVNSPIDGSEIATLRNHSKKECDKTIATAQQAFVAWRDVPAPKRGELVRLFGEVLREHKEPFAKLVTIECGKTLEEGRGEVQEMIDICDYAVGLARQLYGLTIASERPEHTMTETWYPLGPVAVISAFNFPVAVWAWNAALALICGDSVVWKPSEKTPVTALVTLALFERAVARYRAAGFESPQGLVSVLLGDAKTGEALVKDPRIALVSATGSTRMGRTVGPMVAERFGKSLLELGGNNAVIVAPSADLEIAIPSIVFGAVGTCGQRCTTTRRLLVHKSLYTPMFGKLKQAYRHLVRKRIGNPLESDHLIGPLIDKAAFEAMQKALTEARKESTDIFGGQRLHEKEFPDAFYVAPALVKIREQVDIVTRETFAPILYMMPYSSLEEAMELHNATSHGLSSAIFTNDLREAQFFRQYSDCGIANVNIGTSGAEIGGAFGGEKETGGGREAGSDSWRAYMRRQTSTVYFGSTPPALAQGVKFSTD